MPPYGYSYVYSLAGVPMGIPMSGIVRQVGSDAQVPKARGGKVKPPSFEFHVLLEVFL